MLISCSIDLPAAGLSISDSVLCQLVAVGVAIKNTGVWGGQRAGAEPVAGGLCAVILVGLLHPTGRLCLHAEALQLDRHLRLDQDRTGLNSVGMKVAEGTRERDKGGGDSNRHEGSWGGGDADARLRDARSVRGSLLFADRQHKPLTDPTKEEDPRIIRSRVPPVSAEADRGVTAKPGCQKSSTTQHSLRKRSGRGPIQGGDIVAKASACRCWCRFVE